MMFYPHYTPHMPIVTQRATAPVVEKVTPQPSPALKIIEGKNGGFSTSAENVWRLHYIDLSKFEVTLMNGRAGQVVSLKPAKGELLRKPKLFVAVLFDAETGHKSEVEIKSWQPLKVI